jgi:aspartate 1-decarboxylase
MAAGLADDEPRRNPPRLLLQKGLPCPICRVLRTLLKSKIHRATVTDSNIHYEGSITIPTDLMAAADLWEGEKVLVTSITNGQRLETYVITAPAGSGQIVVNGAAAHLISTGHMITIMAFGESEFPITPHRLLLNEQNEIVNTTVL